MLRIENLDKKYTTGDIALSGINLNVEKGQLVALIGPSGAGKSTLIRCVNRLVEPTDGKIWLSGVELTGLRKSRLRAERRRMAMIFQEYALIERLTVMENVLSGQLGYVGFWTSFFRRFKSQTVQEAFDLLARVDLAEHYDKRADELSGGQRQRVGIARAIMQHPDLLLVDEPTASLDPRTARQIMRLLVEMCAEKDLSAIVNIHDVALAKLYLPRIVGLRRGEVVFDGPPEDLTDETLSEIYGKEDWTATRETISAEKKQIESKDEHMAGLT